MTDTPQSVSRSSWRYFSGTLFSKMSGMLRDVTMAFCFGTAPPLAAFLLVYRFVYLIRRLFGESLLHQGFIPHFESKRAQDSKAGARFFRDLFWSQFVALGMLVVVAELFLFCFHGETVRLAMWMLPGIFFICLFGLTTGLLQSERSFFLPSASPAVVNVVWILGVIFLRNLPISQAVIGLSLTLSFAFFIQWGLTLPKVWMFLRRELSPREIFRGALFSAEIKALIGPLLFGVIGVASVQINSAVDGIFARFASPEGPAYLWYAIRMQQLPLALFGLALSSALLPSLSRVAGEGDEGRFAKLLSFAKKRMFTLIFPCVVAIFVLGPPSVNLLFGRGDFSAHAATQTTLCLWSYGIGLLPYVYVQILAPAFYARKDYRTPMVGFVTSSALNIALNALLVFYFKLGPASIALATSIAAVYNAAFLAYKLQHRQESFLDSKKIVVSALLSGGFVLIASRIFLGNETMFHFPRAFSEQIYQFGIQAGLFFALLLSFSKILKIEVYSSSK